MTQDPGRAAERTPWCLAHGEELFRDGGERAEPGDASLRPSPGWRASGSAVSLTDHGRGLGLESPLHLPWLKALAWPRSLVGNPNQSFHSDVEATSPWCG